MIVGRIEGMPRLANMTSRVTTAIEFWLVESRMQSCTRLPCAVNWQSSSVPSVMQFAALMQDGGLSCIPGVVARPPLRTVSLSLAAFLELGHRNPDHGYVKVLEA